MTRFSDTRRRLLALLPLLLAVLAIGIHEATRAAPVPRIAGWLVIAGVALTIAGYAVAFRRGAGSRD